MTAPTTYTLLPPARMGSARVQHTQLRLRMLHGTWHDDLRKHIMQAVGPLRARAWGPPQLVACPARDLAESVSVLYDDDVQVSHSDQLAALDIERRWQTMQARADMQRAQVVTEMCNEAGRFLHVDPDTGRMRLRIVSPDLLDGHSDPVRPGIPVELSEWTHRLVDGRWVWVRESWDIRDPDRPAYRVLSVEGDDITSRVHGRHFGGGPDADPGEWPEVYRWSDGRPFLPWSLTHSVASPASLFSPWYRVETIEATMVAARHSAYIDHSMTHAANPQRNVYNMAPAGSQVREAADGSPAAVVAGDSASVLAWEPIAEDVQAMQWQWQAGAEVGTMQDVYERRLGLIAQSWGLSPSELVRQSSDPRSGVALSLSRAGQREVQMRRAPVYSPHDERLAAMTAAVMNRQDGGTRPEYGYQVSYALLPMSTGEQQQVERETLALLDRRLISRAEARARILGETVESATARLPPEATRAEEA